MNKHYVNRCLRWLANELAPYYLNDALPQEVDKKFETFYDCVGNAIDWYNLTKNDVIRLGFMSWEEDDEAADKGVWFIPFWLFPAIPEGITLTDKDNNEFVFHKMTAPRDVMYGCLTFGITLGEEENDNDN